MYQNAQLAARFFLLEESWAAEITYRVLAVLFMSSIGIPSPTRVARHPLCQPIFGRAMCADLFVLGSTVWANVASVLPH